MITSTVLFVLFVVFSVLAFVGTLAIGSLATLVAVYFKKPLRAEFVEVIGDIHTPKSAAQAAAIENNS